MDRPLLILDLDETLVSASETEPPDGFQFEVYGYYVKRRPHVEEFLARVAAWFDLAVWSAGDEAYAAAIVARLFPPAARPLFVWGRSRCVVRRDGESLETYFLKDMKKVKRRGFDLGRVLIIDDKPEAVSRNYGNHLRIEPFEGESSDRELLDVLPFLEWLKDQRDLRAVEKRAWRRAPHVHDRDR